MVSPQPILLDDRLLIDEVFGRLPGRRPSGQLMTTAYWYYRACRAAVAGGSGHLAGRISALPMDRRRDAIARLLDLPDRITLPDARAVVPAMAELARRHDRLNLLNLEVVASAAILRATVWLTAESAAGVLPAVLDAERVRWRVIERPV
ncbi:MAG: hypothetical protein ACTHN0_14730 [Aquihabitans sp.]